jgi:hypothetical protein
VQVRLRIAEQSIHELARFRESIGSLEHRDDREQRAGGRCLVARAWRSATSARRGSPRFVSSEPMLAISVESSRCSVCHCASTALASSMRSVS